MLLYLLDCCLLSSVVVSTVHRPPADSDFFRSLIISDTVGQPSPSIARMIIFYKQYHIVFCHNYQLCLISEYFPCSLSYRSLLGSGRQARITLPSNLENASGYNSIRAKSLPV